MIPQRSFLLLFATCCLLLSCDRNKGIQDEPLDILERIQKIEGIIVKELETQDHFERLFEIKIVQPVDHRQPNGQTFFQKLYLGHVDEEFPVAFETEGYARSEHKTRELAPLLTINQLTVEHRYFGESVPQNLDWKYLNIWQAANDHHRIVEIFKEIYPAAWISSGASKGGDAAIFHRRFFPNDVEATVAYVAPILFEEEDTRYLEYYKTTGNEECRQKMKNYQRMVLMNIDAFSSLFETYVEQVNEAYNTSFTFSIPFKNILYHAIREDYAFEFWSSEIENCATIPDENATVEELFNHFVGVFNIFLFFSDYGAEFWTPWYYQAKTEMGSYAYDLAHLEDLTMNIPPLVSFNVPTNFDPSVMADIDNWVRTESSNMILIYGEDDPWTHTAFEISNTNNNLKIINPGTKHGTRIADLSLTNKNLVMGKLLFWLGL